VGPWRGALASGGFTTKIFFKKGLQHLGIANMTYIAYNRRMLSLHFTPREVRATESRLQRVYEAARLGLSNDALALKAGMMPEEFRKLCQLDPVVELAVMQGRATSEAEMSQVVREAALAGDAKMALEFLKHKHDWVAKQQVQVDVTQQISIITALEQAEARLTIDMEPTDANDTVQRRRRDAPNVSALVAQDQG
jgi:hypothetical protein